MVQALDALLVGDVFVSFNLSVEILMVQAVVPGIRRLAQQSFNLSVEILMVQALTPFYHNTAPIAFQSLSRDSDGSSDISPDVAERPVIVSISQSRF